MRTHGKGGEFCGIKLQSDNLKRKVSFLAVIALAALIGFSFAACDTGGGNENGGGDGDGAVTGSGQYNGKDVLGNTYSLSVGSDSSRAAVKGDRFKMNVKTRDGKNRSVSGVVTNVSADGTITLKQDGSADEFTATVGGNNLNSVASEGDVPTQITLDDGTKIVPRTFDKILLRATRWSVPNQNDPSTGPMRGEHYGSLLSVLVKDFPTNVSKLQKDDNRYTITISGTSDKDLDHVKIEIQGLTEDDEWVYLGGYGWDNEHLEIKANQPFNRTVNVHVTGTSVSHDLMDYKEIILQVTNVINEIFEDHPDWDANINNGSIPADIPNGQIMATISNFNISLKDKNREALAGNMGDYTFGFKEDGLSVEYRNAVWSLSAVNVAEAKKSGARFEFFILDVEDVLDPGTALHFAWQDPVRGLWWQDYAIISEWSEQDSEWFLNSADGVSWDSYRKKVTVDLSRFIKDNRFAASTQLNFIVACYWNNGRNCRNIDELAITGANIVVPPPPSAGNMGNYYYGYQGDGITTHYKQAVWSLSEDILTKAKLPGAKLELVFNNDIKSINGLCLAFVWQGVLDNGDERWWPSAEEEGQDGVNLKIFENNTAKSGVTYDQTAKKLTINMETGLENYNSFKNLSWGNFVLDCWWGVNHISELGIKSANIITNQAAGETVKGSYLAYAGNPHTQLTSSVDYQIVDLADGNRTDVVKVTFGSIGDSEWAVALYNLADKKGQNVKISFSAVVKRVGAAGTLNWQVMNDTSYPSVGTIDDAAADTWHSMSGEWTGALFNKENDNPSFYLSTYENHSANATYYIDDFVITVTQQ